MLSVRVHANARRSQVIGFADGVLEVRVAAPPVKGKANRELLELLSRALGIGRREISVVRGHTARNKVIAVGGLSQEEVMGRLSPSRLDL